MAADGYNLTRCVCLLTDEYNVCLPLVPPSCFDTHLSEGLCLFSVAQLTIKPSWQNVLVKVMGHWLGSLPGSKVVQFHNNYFIEYIAELPPSDSDLHHFTSLWSPGAHSRTILKTSYSHFLRFSHSVLILFAVTLLLMLVRVPIQVVGSATFSATNTFSNQLDIEMVMCLAHCANNINESTVRKLSTIC